MEAAPVYCVGRPVVVDGVEVVILWNVSFRNVMRVDLELPGVEAR